MRHFASELLHVSGPQKQPQIQPDRTCACFSPLHPQPLVPKQTLSWKGEWVLRLLWGKPHAVSHLIAEDKGPWLPWGLRAQKSEDEMIGMSWWESEKGQKLQ